MIAHGTRRAVLRREVPKVPARRAAQGAQVDGDMHGRHARHAEVIPVSRSYCDELVKAGVRCNVGTDCQVNGAAWYQITGSLQDWAFHFLNQIDTTIEATTTKRPAAKELPGLYAQQRAAIASYMLDALKQ